MIYKVTRDNIDIQKYQTCIDNSINYTVYAEYWYLDIVTNKKWNCYIYQDYKYVMPIPYKIKYGLSYIIMPVFSQQLGVFYPDIIPEEIFKLFSKKLKYKLIRSYYYNHNNTKNYKLNGKYRNNYMIHINSNISKRFNSNTKRNIKKAIKNELYIEFSDSEDKLIYLKASGESFYKFEVFKKLTLKLISMNRGEYVNVKKGDDIISSCFIITNKSSIIYLYANNTSEGRKLGAMHYMISEIISKYSNKVEYLDFEGSMVEGIINFFKGFRAENYRYKNVSIW